MSSGVTTSRFRHVNMASSIIDCMLSSSRRVMVENKPCNMNTQRRSWAVIYKAIAAIAIEKLINDQQSDFSSLKDDIVHRAGAILKTTTGNKSSATRTSHILGLCRAQQFLTGAFPSRRRDNHSAAADIYGGLTYLTELEQAPANFRVRGVA